MLRRVPAVSQEPKTKKVISTMKKMVWEMKMKAVTMMERMVRKKRKRNKLFL